MRPGKVERSEGDGIVTAPGRQRPTTRPEWPRRRVLAGLAAAPAALAAACTGDSDGPGHPDLPDGGRVSAVRITVDPPDGTRNADFDKGVTVTAAHGRLTSVKVRDDDGKQLAGAFSADSTRWTSTGTLGLSTRYSVAVGAVDGRKLPADSNTAFTTKAPDHTFVGFFTPEDGSTSGVGMPVSINFTTGITHRKAVQRAITVHTDPPVEVVGHWFDATRLDFRPEHYWAPGTRITLRLRLKDVAGAKGVYGVQSKDVHFTIGRSQVSVVDLATRQMAVSRDGLPTAIYAITGGGPEHTTWSGRMVISEQFLQTRMNSRTVGLGGEYDIADVPHAQRLTASGTFIHGNYWTPPPVFGQDNVSHGCIGLLDTEGAADPATPAAEFYGSSMVGDVVEVVNSGDRPVSPSNGLNGWNLTWAQWKAGSAL
ncbi:Ig-like domain-containing protein [Peterkaempfera sp. SMS 1(5)a]|uniref:L,D-transpeptidase n=1 Tax=Peterkaempfera podocarpi TaxID=3232308 RepID=UPI00366CCCE0